MTSRTIAAAIAILSSPMDPGRAAAGEVIWVLHGPARAVISTRPAVEGRTIEWRPHQSRRRGERVEVAIDLPPRAEGYDVSIQPLDQSGNPTQEPLDSKQPVKWEALPGTVHLAFAIAGDTFPLANLFADGKETTFAGPGEDVKKIRNSTWSTNYTDIGGVNQAARLRFAGSTGTFQLGFCKVSLAPVGPRHGHRVAQIV